MTAILIPPRTPTIRDRLVILTPYQMYLEQVAGVSDQIRATRRGLSYLPAQFGGLKGQRETLNSRVAVQMVDFENSE